MPVLKLKYEQPTPCRIDIFIANNTELTRSLAAKLCEQEQVRVNGQCVKKNYNVCFDQEIEINIKQAEECTAKPQNIPLDIVYEDDDLLVVNKPKDMVVHPAPGNYENTLVNALLYHCGDSLSGINGVIRPGIVHRIDKDTSGLLMVAKNDNSHNFLSKQIKDHSFLREYEAIVYGNVKNDSGQINLPIGRHPVKRKQMCVNGVAPREAVTYYNVIERYNGFTHLRLKLETGRTHQIRVHLSHIGHPVAGDTVYGPKKAITSLKGQCLHAKCLGFEHPNGEFMKFESDLPEYFKKFQDKLRNKV